MISRSVTRIACQDLRSPFRLWIRDRTTVTSASTQSDTGVKLKPFEDIPGTSGIQSWNKVGSFFMFYPFTAYKIETLHKLFDYLHDKYGKIVRMQLGSTAVLVSDVEDLTKVFRHDAKYPVRRAFPLLMKYYEENKHRSPTLAILNGPAWYEIRSAIQSRMGKPNSALYYLSAQNVVADEFIQILKSRDFTAEELRDEFFKYASESIGVVCFNARLGCFEDPSTEKGAAAARFLKNIVELFSLTHESLGTLPLWNIYPTKLYRRYEAALNGVHEMGLKQVNNAFAELKKREAEGTLDPDEPNFLLALINDGKLTTPQIATVVEDLFTGGTDSTAKNLCWTLYHLANNKEKQERLYEEISTVLGNDNEIKASHLNKLSYLQACLKETFRLTFPTSCGTSRILDQDIGLSGYNIPKGTVIFANSRRAVLDEDVIDQPLKFLPERWLRDKSGKRESEIPTMAMIPFGFGVRNCPGRRFAELEIHLAVAKIIKNFEVSFGPNFKHPDVVYHTFATPSHAIDFKVRSRT